MNDTHADSAGAPGEATGANPTNVEMADSTLTPGANGQEQGDQSKRVNALMSLANRRLVERDAALAEIETLKMQLAEREAESRQPDEATPSQVELMYPERFAQPEEAEEVDPRFPPEPPVILFDPNASFRPDHMPQPGQPLATSPAARFVQDQADIASLKAQLNRAGQTWVDNAREQGLLD